MKLSEYVKTFRVLNKLSLRTMADKCGCSFQYLAKLENDEVNNPSLDMVRRIADGTGTSLHELLELVDNVDVKLAHLLERTESEMVSTIDDIREKENV